MNINKKVAVITGAASGIGFALTKACLTDGMNVVMADIDKEKLDVSAKLLRDTSTSEVISMVCDVSNFSEVMKLASLAYSHFNQVDLLINNAGISGNIAPLWEQSVEDIHHVIDVNLYGVINGIKAFIPLMFKQKNSAHIVNMASIYGLCSGSQMAPYAMSKHAIVAMSESLYFDFIRLKKPIDISVVCPSFANTQLMTNSKNSNSNKLHSLITNLMERSRSVEDLADYIMAEIEKKTFYILPDKEVKAYCEARTDSIINQSLPHQHSLEKIISTLSKRANGE